MKQLNRDYKNLRLPEVYYDNGFANGFVNGFMAAVLLMTVIIKLLGVIP